jgi:hypothetical protein
LRFNGGIIASWWDVIDQGSLWGGRTGYIEMTRGESHTLTHPGEIEPMDQLLKERVAGHDVRHL